MSATTFNRRSNDLHCNYSALQPKIKNLPRSRERKTDFIERLQISKNAYASIIGGADRKGNKKTAPLRSGNRQDST